MGVPSSLNLVLGGESQMSSGLSTSELAPAQRGGDLIINLRDMMALG
jgi:hypothetical protein